MTDQPATKGLTVAIIPARGGSKGVPGKNLRRLHSTPLIAHTIRAARNSKMIDMVVVTSDDKEILAVSRANNAEIILRPAELATDEAPTEPALEHAVEHLEKSGVKIELVVLLQCTSPLRKEEDIDNALTYFNEMNADSLLSVCETHHFFWKRSVSTREGIAQYDYKNRPRRQDMKEEDIVYIENGAIYVTKRDILMKEHNRLGGKIAMFIMPEFAGLEIDTEFDFWLAEELIEYSGHTFPRMPDHD